MLRYTYINKSIETASIANDACTMTSDEKIPVSVNTYNAVAPAIRVTYSCVVDGNTVLPETQLTQNTDWNWSGMAKLPADCKGKRIFITAKALFNNGETAISRSSFVYQPAPKRADAIARCCPVIIPNVPAPDKIQCVWAVRNFLASLRSTRK